MKSVKMAVIGLGHVGAHVAWMIVKEGLADELVLIDSNEAKAKNERQDSEHIFRRSRHPASMVF